MFYLIGIIKFCVSEIGHYLFMVSPQNIKITFSDMRFEVNLSDEKVNEILTFRRSFLFSEKTRMSYVIVEGKRHPCIVDVGWLGKIYMKCYDKLKAPPIAVDVDLNI